MKMIQTLTRPEALIGLCVLCLFIYTIVGVVIGQVSVQRDYSAVGNASDIATAMFNYSTDHGTFPTGKTSTEALKKLFPTYLQDPNIRCKKIYWIKYRRRKSG